MKRELKLEDTKLLRCDNCGLPQVRRYDVEGNSLCARCAISEMILGDQDAMERVLPLILEKRICAYCGEYGHEVEHVIARCQKLPTWTVYACRECNGIAGGRLFTSFASKREYIRKRLRAKYSRYLRIPEWTRDEFEDIAPHLVKSIQAAAGVGEWIRSRVEFDICIDEITDGSFHWKDLPSRDHDHSEHKRPGRPATRRSGTAKNRTSDAPSSSRIAPRNSNIA